MARTKRSKDSTEPEVPETTEPTEPKTEGKVSAKDVLERYAAGLKPLRAQHFNYWMNDSYVIGDQWLRHDPVNDRIETVPVEDNRVQVTVNHMWPTSRTIIAKAVQNPLQFYVPPTGADDAVIRGARTSESILVDLHREHDWEGVREDAHWAAWKGGTSAIRIVWDSEAGTPLGMSEDGRQYGTGDTYEDVLNITDFVIEPGSRDGEHARWWAVCVGLPPKRVQEMFSLKEEPAADGASASTPFNRTVAGLGTNDGSKSDVPLTKVTTLYHRPCGGEDGYVISVVGETVVDRKPWPFPFKDRLNMVLIRETRRDGSWVGETVLKSARPIQNAINASWSNILEHIKLAGNARLMIPESMMDTLEQLTDTAGEMIPFPDGNGEMKYLSPPQLASWVIDAPDKFKAEMDDLLGVHEVSRGEAPGRVDSGLAISILVEQDATPIGRFIKETAGAFGRLATMALMLYEANVKETRTAVVKTPGQPARQHRWTGKALKGQVQAEVPVDAIKPRNAAADQAMADNMMQMGVIKSVEEYHKVARIPFDRDILEALSPDVAKARRENAAMDLGEICVPEQFDDHVQHIAEHLTMMKSAEWDLMKEETREVFRKHNQAHETLAAEQMGRQRAKGNVDPALMAAADANGAPILPMQALPAGPAGAGTPMAPPAAMPIPVPAPAPLPLPGGVVPGLQPPDPISQALLQNEIGGAASQVE